MMLDQVYFHIQYPIEVKLIKHIFIKQKLASIFFLFLFVKGGSECEEAILVSFLQVQHLQTLALSPLYLPIIIIINVKRLTRILVMHCLYTHTKMPCFLA